MALDTPFCEYLSELPLLVPNVQSAGQPLSERTRPFQSAVRQGSTTSVQGLAASFCGKTYSGNTGQSCREIIILLCKTFRENYSCHPMCAIWCKGAKRDDKGRIPPRTLHSRQYGGVMSVALTTTNAVDHDAVDCRQVCAAFDRHVEFGRDQSDPTWYEAFETTGAKNAARQALGARCLN